VVLNTLYVAAVLALFPVSVEFAGLTFMCLWPLVSFVALRYWTFR
jgi:hypothetical protein